MDERDRDTRLFQLLREARSLPEPERDALLADVRQRDTDLASELSVMLRAPHESTPEAATPEAALGTSTLRGALRIPDADRSLVGSEVGTYRVVEEIGRGGMGVVYRAVDSVLERDVALKVIRSGREGPLAEALFESERKTLAKFKHAHIAPVHDGGLSAEGVPYLVMEYVEGETICAYADARRLAVRGRVALFRDLCEAVEYAHQRQVVHRDVKPGNVLVTEGGEVKLVDFGAASVESEGEGLPGPLTEAYASPEQRRGEPARTVSDVYSLGVLLGELLAGRRLDPGERLAARGGELDDLDRIVAKATAEAPEARYGSAAALSEDLRRSLSHEPLVGVTESGPRRARKFVRRHRQPLAGIAVAVAVLAIGLGLAFRQVAEARDDAIAEAERAARVQEFTQALFQGDEGAGPADTLRVQTILMRGLRQAMALRDQPETRVEFLQTLGALIASRGQLTLADSVLGVARDEAVALWGADDARTVAGHLALGEVWKLQDRSDKAVGLVEGALRGWRTRRAADQDVEAEALRLLGSLQVEIGDYEASLETLRASIRLWETLPRGVGWSKAISDRVIAEYLSGNMGAADSLNRLALAFDRSRYGRLHPYVGASMMTDGAMAQGRGEYERAEASYREGRSIFASYFGGRHPQTVLADVSLGRALQYQGRLAGADSLLRRALAVQEARLGPVHGDVASTLNDLALIAEKRGDYEAAEGYLRRMESIYREVSGPDHYLVGLAISNRSGVYQTAGRYREAERAAREALAVYARTLPDDHRHVVTARLKVGRAMVSQGRYREAVPLLVAAYDYYVEEAPGSRYQRSAAQSIVAAYEGMGVAERAAPYRDAAEADGSAP